MNHTPLSPVEFRAFWISWDGGIIRTGSGRDPTQREFLSWRDPSPFDVNYISVSSGWESTAIWIFGISKVHFCPLTFETRFSLGLTPMLVSGYLKSSVNINKTRGTLISVSLKVNIYLLIFAFFTLNS